MLNSLIGLHLPEADEANEHTSDINKEPGCDVSIPTINLRVNRGDQKKAKSSEQNLPTAVNKLHPRKTEAQDHAEWSNKNANSTENMS
jgi:hypothetical protein